MSGIEALRNMVHREALRIFYRFTRRVPCVVSSYNPEQHAVKVALLPEGTLTGWMQIGTDQIGGQVAPNIGDPGWVEFHEADRRAGIFVSSNHNDQNPPPVQIQAGERRYQTKWGQFLYFKSDGSITVADGAGATIALKSGVATVTDKAGSTLSLNGDGTATLKANLTVNGTITATGDVVAGSISLQNHLTTGVQPGGGTSGPPTG